MNDIQYFNQEPQMDLVIRWKANSRPLVAGLVLVGLVAGLSACTTKAQIARERYQANKAEFNRLCKDVAGYKIYKVVEDVEGIQLLKVRHKVKWADPMAPGAAFALESWDDGYITGFLGYRYPSKEMDRSYDVNTMHHDDDQPGFRYVDVIDEQDGKRYRYTGRWEELWLKDKRYLKGDIHFFLDRAPAPDPAPRYAVTFEDHVVPAERARGLASSTVKVIDTQTNEVLGEMLRYAWSPGKGSPANPSPWLTAYKCPGVSAGSGHATRQFVDHVIVARGSTRLPVELSPRPDSKN